MGSVPVAGVAEEGWMHMPGGKTAHSIVTSGGEAECSSNTLSVGRVSLQAISDMAYQ
ncbi:hypothetical protein [Methanogenium cariaci]|uniref:hypothetical protein n=1 Tax=Methanogenium cariaci TaxID=2197 RepID=UPI0012F64037|nr:hypothetical protein [Methanogenium cariaci]